MKNQQEVAKFAYLQYKVLHELSITIPEYWYLDMVYQLSRGGWCYKSLENIAQDMRMTKNGVVKMRNRLTDKGLIIKGRSGKVKTSVKYNSVYFSKPAKYNSVTNRTTEYNADVQLSGTKNNNEINIEKEVSKKRASRSTVESIKQTLLEKGLIRGASKPNQEQV